MSALADPVDDQAELKPVVGRKSNRARSGAMGTAAEPLAHPRAPLGRRREAPLLPLLVQGTLRSARVEKKSGYIALN